MAEFEKVEMSFRNKGLPSLFSQTLHIELLMGPTSDEVYEILNSLGSGRKKSQIIRNVPSSSLIAVENEPNNLCLFLAVTLTLKYKKIQATENKNYRRTLQKHFERLSSGDGYYEQMRNQISRDLLNQIIESGVQMPYNLPAYSVEEHVPLVQEYFYQLPAEDERCRLVVFGEVVFMPSINYMRLHLSTGC